MPPPATTQADDARLARHDTEHGGAWRRTQRGLRDAEDSVTTHAWTHGSAAEYCIAKPQFGAWCQTFAMLNAQLPDASDSPKPEDVDRIYSRAQTRRQLLADADMRPTSRRTIGSPRHPCGAKEPGAHRSSFMLLPGRQRRQRGQGASHAERQPAWLRRPR